jgi:hypothetical protein
VPKATTKTTSPNQSKEPKRNRRNSDPLSALKPEYTWKSRLEYLDADYLEGRYDKNGNQVSRPLTEEEARFYNDFLESTLHDGRNSIYNIEGAEHLTSAQKKCLKYSIIRFNEGVDALDLVLNKMRSTVTERVDLYTKKVEKEAKKDEEFLEKVSELRSDYKESILSTIKATQSLLTRNNEAYLENLKELISEHFEVPSETIDGLLARKLTSDSNNARNRDLYTKQKSKEMLYEYTPQSVDHSQILIYKDELETRLADDLDARIREENGWNVKSTF